MKQQPKPGDQVIYRPVISYPVYQVACEIVEAREVMALVRLEDGSERWVGLGYLHEVEG